MENDIRYLPIGVVSHVLELLEIFLHKLSLQVLTVRFNNSLDNLLEGGCPNRVLCPRNVCYTFFDDAHAQCQSSNLRCISIDQAGRNRDLHTWEVVSASFMIAHKARWYSRHRSFNHAVTIFSFSAARLDSAKFPAAINRLNTRHRDTAAASSGFLADSPTFSIEIKVAMLL